MTTINLTSKTWGSVEQSKLPVVVDFWAPMCSYCKSLAPIFEELSKEYEGKAVFAKLNIYESTDIAEKYAIKGVPVIKVFCNGIEVAESLGFVPKELLEEFVEKAMTEHVTCMR